MPPFIPQKRLRSRSPLPDSSTPGSKKRSKPSLFDTADKPKPSATLQDNKTFLDQLNGSGSESGFSDISSDEFEDVLSSAAKRRKVAHHQNEEDEDAVEWEDAMQTDPAMSARSGPEPSGDLELTLDGDTQPDYSTILGKKKGPSKKERERRVAAHCLHVQFLLFHNLVKSGWACDKEVQGILIQQLPANVKAEVEKWRLASGMAPVENITQVPSRQRRKGKKTAQSERNQRDWGKPAEKQEKGKPNMSRGDPLIRLLKVLAAYWKKRFTITAPALRKQGHKSPASLAEEIASFKKDKHNAIEHGERVRNIEEFRDLAKKCEGSRDIGAQLFTALIRGLGLEARLVASLQPVGFGWSKGEEAAVKRKKSTKVGVPEEEEGSVVEEDLGSECESVQPGPKTAKVKSSKQSRRSRGAKDAPIDLSEESGEDKEDGVGSDEDGSVVDITPKLPRQRPNMKYDRDLVFPTYWTEVISPITNEVYPVDSLVLNPAVATNAELLAAFESRGAKADKAKQVFAYIVAYSPDGTAKDVTTRYLKRHIWPGRTKGVRMPVEKIPVYNHRGKIKRYEDYNWFKTVMAVYNRTDGMRTEVDDIEESKDLKAVKPEKKEIKAGEDTLQAYKTSADFVLERFLRREEALRPGAKPVKIFASGKGDKAKEEQVYLRKDVEVCRTGESWHKEGRAIKPGETPMKMVPVRAVTLTRKREVEEAERDSGEKAKQGLYAWDQTDWIIPPPIENGVIPKNAFGNMDCYVPTMVPKGAVHIPLRSTVRVCKKLAIDFAEAVTGFEFGNKRAVPVITGVVVAKENENAVIDLWEKEEEERRIKEEGKREKMALGTWRKWLMGLRIIQRVREEYGGDADTDARREEMNPFTNQNEAKKAPSVNTEDGSLQRHGLNGALPEDVGGGFLVEDDVEGGGFLAEAEPATSPGKEELLVEDESTVVKNKVPAFATLENRSRLDDSEHLEADPQPKEQEPSPSPSPTPKTKLSNHPTRKPHPKPKPPPPKNPTRYKKRKPSPSPSPLPPDDNHYSLQESPARKPSRAAPKRKAARKSETAVKSHYFNHDSDDEERGGGESEGGEVEDGEEEVRRKGRGGKGGLGKGRGRRKWGG